MGLTDRMVMRYFRETAFGVAPSPPTQSTLIITSEDLTSDFPTVESEAVLGDRQVRDLVRVGADAEGTVNFELSYGNLDDLLEGALANSWPTSGALENASDLISFGFEKDFQDVSGAARYYAFAGCRVGSLNLSFTPRERITGSLGVMGKGGVFSGSTVGDGSPIAAVENPMMVSTGTLVVEEAGVALDIVTNFNFTVDNGLRKHLVLGQDTLRNIQLGTFRVTGTLEAYFEDVSLINKLLNDTPSDFVITTEDSDANSYTWTFPRFKFTGLSGPNNTGRNADVMQSLTWTALRDPSTGITMSVAR